MEVLIKEHTMILKPQKRKSLFSAATLAVLLAVGTPSIVLAQNHRQGGPERQAVVASESIEVEQGTAEENMMRTTTVSDDSTEKQDSANRGREKAKVKVETLRADKGAQVSAEKREQACEKRKNGLQTKFAAISKNSIAFQTRIDDIYAKSLAFQTSNSVASEELTALVAAADDAKTQASVSVGALQLAETTTVDCKNVDVATDVAAFKESALQARDDLKTYKQAVKDVIKALKTAEKSTAPEASETTETTESPENTDATREETN